MHPFFPQTTMYFIKLLLSKLHVCVCSSMHLCVWVHVCACTHVFEYSSGFALMDDQLGAWRTKWATPQQWAMNTWTYVWDSAAALWLYLKPPGTQCYLSHNSNTLYLYITSCWKTGISKIHTGLVTNVGPCHKCGWQVLFWFLSRWRREDPEQKRMLR